MTVDVTALILTHNEELNLERCLASLHGWTRKIVVVDSGSDDATVEIARRFTDHVLGHPFENHLDQWSWALENSNISTEWVLALDADYVVTDELRAALEQAVADPAMDGYYIRKLFVFRGRPIRHGGVYPQYTLRLFRPEKVFLDPADVEDQHFYVRGRVGQIDSELREENVKDRELAFWIDKQNRVAKLQVMEELNHRRLGRIPPEKPTPFGTHNQKVLWKKGIWVKLPPYWRSVFYFLYRYILRLGFLDGKAGFLYHLTQALMYRVLLDARLDELERGDVKA